MTAHTHTEYVQGCYRCDLSRDEVIALYAAIIHPDDDALVVRLVNAAHDAGHPLSARAVRAMLRALVEDSTDERLAATYRDAKEQGSGGRMARSDLTFKDKP